MEQGHREVHTVRYNKQNSRDGIADSKLLTEVHMRERKLTVNACGYVKITETKTYLHFQITSVNGARFTTTAVRPYTSQTTPICRNGNYPGWQTQHFMKDNVIYAYTNARPGNKVIVKYQ